jgi:hypothetical protein
VVEIKDPEAGSRILCDGVKVDVVAGEGLTIVGKE